jgi:DNA-directed RNA polymerase specialized sigma24 family protein
VAHVTLETLNEEEQRKRAWSVYLDHVDVFHAVLRHTGPWRISEGVDVVNDFVVERLPKALNTYDPSRPLRPWLYTIFDRYARRKRGEISGVLDRAVYLGHLVEELPARRPDTEAATAEQLSTIAAAIEELPRDLKQCLHAYFNPGPTAGSFRAIAARAGISRYESKRRIFAALAAILDLLKPHELFPAEEFQVAHSYLEEAATYPENSPERGQESVLRSSLETLLGGVARALAGSPSGAFMSTDKLFDELVTAIKGRNEERVESLREHWDKIGAFVEVHPDLPKRIRLSDEDAAVLILWLSTPPALRPIPWTELPDPKLKVDRENRVELIRHLWSAWQTGRILGQLEKALASFRHRSEWMRLARPCFENPQMPNTAGAEECDSCLRAVLGYSALIAQRLLAQRNRDDVWLQFDCWGDKLVLFAPDESRLPGDALAEAISFSSGINGPAAHWLADAVSLSLPAHREVLPDIKVTLERDAYRLRAVPDDHFKRHLDERLQRERHEFGG